MEIKQPIEPTEGEEALSPYSTEATERMQQSTVMLLVSLLAFWYWAEPHSSRLTDLVYQCWAAACVWSLLVRDPVTALVCRMRRGEGDNIPAARG
jgi:hypothetical protein